MFKQYGERPEGRPDEVPAAVQRSQQHTDVAAHPIAVVDDDASVRDSLSVLLETLGFEVFTHGSGGQLLADARHRRAGCLIIDQHMPGMDGIELLLALRREGIGVPVILITGRLDPAISARAAAVGVTAILEKPFPTRRLIELVQSSLEDRK